MMTKNEMRNIIDSENGLNYNYNVNLQGYTFTKDGSFITFEFKFIEDIKICHIKYIYFKNVKDLVTIMVTCCNFWMGNKIQFIFYKEKKKLISAVKFLENLNFRVEIIEKQKWKYKFECKEHKNNECDCIMYSLCK